MLLIDKVTTKVGDGGETSFGGEMVSKTGPIIEFIGVLDELNANIGMVRFVLSKNKAVLDQKFNTDVPTDFLLRIQNTLFDIGADIHCDGTRVTTQHIQDLEAIQQRLNADLKPLNSFLISGHDEISTWLHIARAKTRSVERQFWRVVEANKKNKHSQPNQTIGIYLNRLSDLFFVMIRCLGDQELWIR